jgi:hypothetical protein
MSVNVLFGIFCIAAAVLFSLIGVISLLRDFYHRACRESYRSGYHQGMRDAQDWSELSWWAGAEQQVHEARKEIRREEPKEGRWP